MEKFEKQFEDLDVRTQVCTRNISILILQCYTGLKLRACNRKLIYYSTKTFVLGTQKNRLN